MPIIHIHATDKTIKSDTKLYACPLYKKPSRTDSMYITLIYLPSILDSSHWIMRGVALLCDTEK